MKTHPGPIPLHPLTDGPSIGISAIEDRPTANFMAHHRHDFYLILFFTQPLGKLWIDFVPFLTGANQVYLIRPDQIVFSETEIRQGHAIFFSKDAYHRVMDGETKRLFSPLRATQLTIDADILPDLALLIQLCYRETSRTKTDTALLKTYLQALLHQLSRQPVQLEPDLPLDIQRFHTIVEAIEQHYTSQRETSFYAQLVCLSAKRANELMVAHSGKTIKQFVLERLVLEAKREIYHGCRSLKEIAFQLGFSEPGYFSRFFKKYTSLTPEAFGRQNRNSC